MPTPQLKFVLFLTSLIIVEVAAVVYTEDQFNGMNWCQDESTNLAKVQRACQRVKSGYQGACEEVWVSLAEGKIKRKIGVCKARDDLFMCCVTENSRATGMLKWSIQGVREDRCCHSP